MKITNDLQLSKALESLKSLLSDLGQGDLSGVEVWRQLGVALLCAGTDLLAAADRFRLRDDRFRAGSNPQPEIAGGVAVSIVNATLPSIGLRWRNEQ